MLKQKKCSGGGGQWWRENNRNVEMQKGRKGNEERSFLVAERDSLPSCSLSMHDLCAKNQLTETLTIETMKATGHRMCIITFIRLRILSHGWLHTQIWV